MSQNGVSTYPVTVTLDETYDLLPGMNVDGYITLESAKDALTIPSNALMRGNKVYVRDNSATEAKAGSKSDESGAANSSGDGLIPAGFKEVTVTTGVINSDFVQITSGLNEGDEVYVDETADMSVGGTGADGMPADGGGAGAGAEGAGAGEGAGTEGAGGADAGGADAGAGGQ